MTERPKARKRVETEVPKHIDSWGALLGLPRKDARFDQFKEDVTEALHACMRVHIAEKHRRYHRYSDLGEDFIALEKAATAAIAKLRDVENILKRLPPMQRDPAFRLIHDPWATAFELDGLAKAARRHAEECKSLDRGGKPRMRAFEQLVAGLVIAYRHATKRRGTGRSARAGKLLDLVEAVLPAANKIAENATGNALTVSRDTGDYVHRIARRL